MARPLVLARRALRYELSMYRSLFRWVTRRPAVPAGAVPYGYVGVVAAVLWAFVGVSAVELVALHLLIPWETVRLVADVLGVWGLVWMLGLTAGLTIHPHLLTEEGLRVRNGAGTDVAVPWEAIAGVGVRERAREGSRAVQLDETDAGTVLNVVVGSRVNLHLTLRHPLVVQLPKGPATVTEVRLCADDARGLARQVRERLSTGEGAAR
jgi:hypothetical protein